MMTYLLQVSTCWIVFYGIYMLFLQKETFFTINRYYLLGSLITGLLIPLIGGYLPANQASAEIYSAMTQITEITEIELTPQEESTQNPFSWMTLVYLIYNFGAFVVLLRFTYGLSKIHAIYKHATKTKTKHYTLVESTKYHLPFSFFQFIFISKSLPLTKDVEHILKHEELHANQWHSLDIVFSELLQVFFWFNPILLFYKKALKQSHEFLADAYVTKDHNRSSYGQLLLRQSTSGLEIALANHFFHSQIKKRITMMYKEKSKRPAMVKYLTAVPILITLLFLFSSNRSSTEAQTEFNEDECLSIKIEEHNKYSIEGNPLTINEYKAILNGNSPPKCIDLNINHSVYVNSVTPIIEAASLANIEVRLNNGEEEGEMLKATLGENWDKIKNKLENQGDPIFKVVEEMPRFPGCEEGDEIPKEKEQCAKKKMLEFIYQNITYPTEARNEDIEGMTIIQFTIEKNGTISDAKILRDLAGGCGDESLRVVNSMPTWIPGKQKGKTVRVQYTLPIKFKLEDKKDNTEQKNSIVNMVAFGEKSEQVTKENLSINKGISPENNKDIYKVVEQMPRFPGCEDDDISQDEKKKCAQQKMLEYIYTNLKYPKEAREKGIEGMAVVQMIIEKDGSVTSSIIARDPGAGTGSEAKRVVDMMPKWIPGKQQGKKVRVQYNLPIKYKLEGETKEKRKQYLIIEKSKFVKIEDLKTLMLAAGFEHGCEVMKYRVVHIPPGSEAYMNNSTQNKFDGRSKELILNANAGDRYIVEEINCKCPGDKEAKDYGFLMIKISEDVDQTKVYAKPKSSSLKIKRNDFMSLKSIKPLLDAAELNSDCKIDNFRIVKIREGEDVPTCNNNTALFQENSLSLLEDVKAGDRIFFEEIYSQCNGDLKTKNRGSLSVVIITDNESEKDRLENEVDQIPLFPESTTKEESVQLLLDFVFKNVTYPKEAKQSEIEGLSLVKFIINSKGEIQNIRLAKSLGWGIDEVVLEMMDKMKEIETPWTPALADHRNVTYEYVLPIKFKLQDHQKEEVTSSKLNIQSMNIKPNPSNGIFTLEFTLQEKTQADVIFYSMNGQRIKSLSKVNVPFSKSIDLSEYSGQTIYVRIIQNDKIHTEKVIIQ